MPAKPRTMNGLIIASQVLALLALLLGLAFLINTTGATVFLFSWLSPVLVFAAIAILVAVAVYRNKTSNHMFDIRTYEPGEIIFREGDVGDYAYFIHSGEVEVVREHQGQQQVIARLGKDQYFGEMALITNARRNATIRAGSRLRVALLAKDDFLTLVSVLPGTKEDIMKTVQSRAMTQVANRR